MRCGYEVGDIGRSLSWGALSSFLMHLESDSALVRELEPELYEWSSRLKTNMILADIFDMLAMINANLVAVGSHSQTKKPALYPRPKQAPEGEHYGSKPVTSDELRSMCADKRRKRRGHG